MTKNGPLCPGIGYNGPLGGTQQIYLVVLPWCLWYFTKKVRNGYIYRFY